MAKARVNRSQSRETALQVLFCQSFTDSELSRSVRAVEATTTVESFQEAIASLEESVRSANTAIATLRKAIGALKEAQKPVSERKHKNVESGTLSTVLDVGATRRDAINSMRQHAQALETAHTLFDPEGFAIRLLETFDKNRQRIDNLVDRSLESWSLRRLIAEDAATLRLGATELLYFTDVPPRVIINEYIELAKRYGDSESPRLVNGILDRILRDHPRESG